jgi:Putative prokaryotic signal transducing protein
MRIAMHEVVVGQYRNQVEAEMWAEFLRDQGIPARVVRAGADIAAVGLDAWVAHDLVVRAEDVQQARTILADPTDDGEPRDR